MAENDIEATQMTTETVNLAMGRIFRLMSRPAQPGDVAEYERCRGLILDLCKPVADHAPNFARDRLKGAQGDG
jgi:hypothetical protein